MDTNTTFTPPPPPPSSVRVGLEVSEETDVSLVVSYVVSNASWSSAYDVRVFTKDKTMKVTSAYLLHN